MQTALYVLSALATVGFGFWAYNVNYDSQAAQKRVAQLQREIAHERERMRMYRAEWVWLNRPERL
ncbi:MAG TPA: cell division protein FtsL, partial [Paracoccaceae bacterium]|nr:cell division protein FtsL [Paracoccaceae bacterium]